jgi:predicted metal-dependent hydrolase
MQIGLPFDLPDPPGGPAPSSTTSTTRPRAIEPSVPGTYFVRHRRARRYLLRVDADGRVRVTIPRGGSQREATAFAERQRAWIERQRTRLVPSTISADDRRTAIARARLELPVRLLDLANAFGLRVSGVSIRSQRTRWGSCARDGRISLNWRLVLMPDWVRDYVLIHELMHLRRMDHSPQYWKLVAVACPSYRDARRWLHEHGPSLR